MRQMPDPSPSRRRDPAAMVRQSDRSHHALPSRPVLDRHVARHTAPSPPTPLRRSRRVVHQAASDLRRCPRRRALCDLARASFGDIAVSTPPNKTPLPPTRALSLGPLPCRTKGQSRANRQSRKWREALTTQSSSCLYSCNVYGIA